MENSKFPGTFVLDIKDWWVEALKLMAENLDNQVRGKGDQMPESENRIFFSSFEEMNK